MNHELIKAVKDHAYKNYDRGWDEIIECWSDAEIWKEISDCKTSASAIRKMSKIVKLRYERRREIESTAW